MEIPAEASHVDPLERAAETLEPVSAAIRQQSIKTNAIAKARADDKALATTFTDALTEKPQGGKAGKTGRIGSLQTASLQKKPSQKISRTKVKVKLSGEGDVRKGYMDKTLRNV